MKLGSAWRKGQEGVNFGKRCRLGVVWVCSDCRIRFSECISTISLEIQLLPLRGCSFFALWDSWVNKTTVARGLFSSLPFWDLYTPISRGLYPGTIHSFCDTKMRSLCDVALRYMLPGQAAKLWWETSSRVSDGTKQKKMIKGSFWSRDVLFYTGISVFAPRRWAKI